MSDPDGFSTNVYPAMHCQCCSSRLLPCDIKHVVCPECYNRDESEELADLARKDALLREALKIFDENCLYSDKEEAKATSLAKRIASELKEGGDD